jgi:hypothetical protein
MTSRREGEAVEEVARFFVWNASFDSRCFQHLLVLHVGSDPAVAALDQAAAREARAFAESRSGR